MLMRAGREWGILKTRLAVIIASLGRGDIVRELTRRLDLQTRPPDRICVCVTTPEDAPAADETNVLEVVLSAKGLCAQRNAGLDHIGDDADLIVFFDDDFVPAPTYLERLEAYFEADPMIAGLTGLVLRDGVTGPGLSFEDADQAIAAHVPKAMTDASRINRTSLYGCNMAYRREAIGALRFDENLPLYGWLEDVDFSARTRQWGPLVKTDALVGVHLGAKGGRLSGLRFGYSQIVNPVYLRRKGTISLTQAADNIGRNLLANHARALAPEPWIDRWGRVRGNWLAIGDLMRGKIDPGRILSF